MNFLKILGIDLGKSRTGLAVAEEQMFFAAPFGTLTETNHNNLIKKISQIIKDENIGKVVIGLPKNMDGSEGRSATNAKKFGQILSKTTGLEVFLQDERCTTVTARRYLNKTDVRGKNRKKIIDTVAATIILQDYLDSAKNSKQ